MMHSFHTHFLVILLILPFHLCIDEDDNSCNNVESTSTSTTHKKRYSKSWQEYTELFVKAQKNHATEKFENSVLHPLYAKTIKDEMYQFKTIT